MPFKMKGKTSSLWRAGDADGMVVDLLVQERRHQEAAAALLQGLVEGIPDEPRVAVTDTLGRCRPALKHALPRTAHRKHQGVNNRPEYSHQPTRQRERAMRQLRRRDKRSASSSKQFGPIREHVCPGYHRLSAPPIALRWAIHSRVGGQ
jgi:putative transposase